ncbi:Uncharacterised protein [Kluyvera cryocrescens]|uniref:Uncharacterized protein n=1 Tax=Kluyvera cryocrescens TaxID=580 RepID=A0A485BPF1_KLUCR|nr:Uncharacterised protein [Kluyvera cryocrescens]
MYFPQLETGRQRHIPRHRIVLFDVIEQRIGDHYLVADACDHGFDMGEQIRMQLGIVQQIVVILLIDIAQDVIHQRFVVRRR